MQVVLTNITPDAELHCEKAARDCYDSISKMKDLNKSTNLIKACTVADHLTVNGHASATFRITGVSRALMGQITRHRTACFSIRSQRYVDEEGFQYVTPPSINRNQASSAIYQKCMQDLATVYETLKTLGVPKEDARMVLPNSCYTTINMTMSFEGWLHYLRRRLDKKAQWEIRELAKQQYKMLNEACPKIFNKETILAMPKYNIDESIL
jgi:thymidylate synthase (FAD)